MDAGDHIWNTLAMLDNDQRRQDLAEAIYKRLGDGALEQHPASILATAYQILNEPVKGFDGFDDLHWAISSPDGLPRIQVDLTCYGEAHDRFSTNAPFYADKMMRDFETGAENDDSGMVYCYLTEDLDDDDRSQVWLDMAQDAQNFAVNYVQGLKLKGWDGWGAVLRDAAATGNHQAVIDALGVGIAPSLADAHGNSPLHLASGAGHGPIIATLIDAGADPDARNAQGKTPLHLAADGRWAVACLNLMAHGADPYARDHRGLIPSARKHAPVLAPSL